MGVEQLLERARTHAGEEDWEGMATVLREHLSDFDREPAVHCWLGVAEREMGLGGIAYDRFKRALELDPTDPYVLATAGNGLAAFDDPDAERALRTAALTAPQVSVARLFYGAYLAREGFFEEALDELRAAHDLDPDDSQIAYELAVAFELKGDHEAAADALSDAVRLDPGEGWPRVMLGLVLLEAGRSEEGVGELIVGARMDAEDVEAQLAAGLGAAVLGHEEIAYEMVERARMRAVSGDAAAVAAVEERIEAGPEAASAMLHEELSPDLLRSRLQERP